jgi:tetratricopeptide (TPR) repeat protein
MPWDVPRDLALARTWTAIGDCRYIGHRKIPKALMKGTTRQAYEAALTSLSRIPRHGPHWRDALIETARANQRLGGYFTGITERDLQRAIRHHDAALEALGERARLDPADAVARRNFADQFVMKATAQNMMQDGTGALESTDRALAMLTPLAAADPKNVEAQRDLAFAHSERGRALNMLGRGPEAGLAYAAAVRIRETLVAADPSNQEDVRELSKLRGQQKTVGKHPL